jgi:tetratricopeptide (TPR) repeat protein
LARTIFERIEGIKQHVGAGAFELAEQLLDQLKRLKADHPAIDDLQTSIQKARRRAANRDHLHHKIFKESLIKANEYLADRHYILAIELCEKVLHNDPENQDAKVIKANCLRQMDQYLAKHREK